MRARGAQRQRPNAMRLRLAAVGGAVFLYLANTQGLTLAAHNSRSGLGRHLMQITGDPLTFHFIYHMIHVHQVYAAHDGPSEHGMRMCSTGHFHAHFC